MQISSLFGLELLDVPYMSTEVILIEAILAFFHGQNLQRRVCVCVCAGAGKDVVTSSHIVVALLSRLKCTPSNLCS